MKDIIDKIVKAGFDVYVVGGYVRDYLLGNSSTDVDIATSAPIEKIEELFEGRGVCFKNFFSYHIEEEGYTYTITTFRKELEYKKNKPIRMVAVDTLKEDLFRRDFTINTLAIDKNDKLVDLLGAKRDLDSHIIRCVGNTKDRFEEDKTRIIRAIRLACVLDFDLDNDILSYLEENANKLDEVPLEFKKKELDRIFNSNHVQKFLFLCKRYNLDKYMKIRYSEVTQAYNKYGYYSQIETDLPLSKEEKNIINSIKDITDKHDISYKDFTIYDENILLNSAIILGCYDKYKLLKEINGAHSLLDIDISIDEMLEYINVSQFWKYYKLIEKNIMEGKLNNNKKDIISFIKR